MKIYDILHKNCITFIADFTNFLNNKKIGNFLQIYNCGLSMELKQKPKDINS